MNLAKQLYKALVGGPLFMILFGLIFFAVGAGLTYRQNDLKARGIQAQGQVVSLAESCDEDGCSYSPVVRFQTRGGQSITFESSYSSSPPSYDIGERVTVYYLAESPGKAIIEGEGSLLRIVFMIAGGVVILIGLGAFSNNVRVIFQARDEAVESLEPR